MDWTLRSDRQDGQERFAFESEAEQLGDMCHV